MFQYSKKVTLTKDSTQYRKLDFYRSSIAKLNGKEYLQIHKDDIKELTEIAIFEISHFLRSDHLEQLSGILQDPDASKNDKFTAMSLMQNADIAAEGDFPMCQDTGTAIVMGKKGRNVITDFDEAEIISHGIYDSYQNNNLRYSQMAPITMLEEVNTKNNLPAQIDIYSEGTDEMSFLFMAKGGGSANKLQVIQATPSLLSDRNKLVDFVKDYIIKLGTAACPPYHLSIVIGGNSAEETIKFTKLASARYLDHLPTKGDESGRAFRDLEMESIFTEIAQSSGIGAQFGGKYFCLDARVIRLARHGASLPIGIGVSCSADRQVKAKINKDGVFIEQLEKNPSKFMINSISKSEGDIVRINTNKSAKDIVKELDSYPILTSLLLTGKILVARDLAHLRIMEEFNKTGNIREEFIERIIYYAGPAKTPKGYQSGSFGPTTANRMDSYIDKLQSHGASLITLAKGNRADSVTDSCKKHNGLYLGSTGGTGALLGREIIKNVRLVAFEDLKMEAIWEIDVVDFPATILIDNKGNNFFAEILKN